MLWLSGCHPSRFGPGVSGARFTPVLLVGGNNALDQRVTNDIATRKLDNSNAFSVPQSTVRFEETGLLVCREVDLRFVPSNDCFGIDTQAGQKHEHLLRRGILRFIKDDESVVQGAPPHIGQGGNFDNGSFSVLLKFIGGQHIMQGIMQWPEVRSDLLIKIARQKAQRFAGFNGGPGENNP